MTATGIYFREMGDMGLGSYLVLHQTTQVCTLENTFLRFMTTAIVSFFIVTWHHTILAISVQLHVPTLT